MGYVAQSFSRGDVFGEPYFGIRILVRSLLPGRPWMVGPFTLLLLLISAATTTIVFLALDITDAPEVGTTVISVMIVLVQFNLTNALSQGMVTSNQMLVLWTALTQCLMKIRTYTHASGASVANMARLDALLTQLLSHAVRVIQSNTRLAIHEHVPVEEIVRDMLDVAGRAEITKAAPAAEVQTLAETTARVLQECIQVNRLDLQTCVQYIDQYTDQLASLLTMRLAYVPFEYNVASVSFFTITYGVFFPISAYPLFGWFYLIIQAVILANMLSNYDTAIRCGDPFNPDSGSTGQVAWDISDVLQTELSHPLATLPAAVKLTSGP